MPSMHIAAHLIRRTMGTKRGLLLNVLIPAILLSVIAGLFASMEGNKAVIMVSNQDAGELGAYLIVALERESLYEVRVETELSEQALKESVMDGMSDAAVYIPDNFTEMLLKGTPEQAAMYRMSEQLWNASLAAILVTESNKLASSAALIRGGEAGIVDPKQLTRLLNEQAKPRITADNEKMELGKIVSEPTMIGLILMFVMLLVGQSIGFVMEDREQRTMARMFTAPLRSIDIALGNFVGSMLVGTFQLVVVLSLTYFVFDYSPGVSFGAMLLVMECFLFAAVGLASAVAGLVRNSVKLSQINTLIITPTCMISGCFFPLSMLPDFLQKLANFTPQKWALQAIDRLGGGETIADISLLLLILLLFAAVLMSFGSIVLKPNKTK